MSEPEQTILTHHALLVPWGQFAQSIGLVEALEQVPLGQKTVIYSAQSKVIEFLVAILSGLPYLKDISRSAHPLDQDEAVAQAWGQAGWADYSGVSRTLSALTEAEVQQITQAVDRISQPFIDKEVMLALGSGRLELDGDLSPRPVSATSRTYPGAEFGHMGDEIGLGYQAEVVSLRSPTYGRIGLSVAQHAGSTVSCTQAAALVQAAEARLGRRPLRRTELLQQRIAHLQEQIGSLQARVDQAQQILIHTQAACAQMQERFAEAQRLATAWQAEYEQRQRPERPYSHLAKAKQQVGVYAGRLRRRQEAVVKAQAWLERQQASQKLAASDQARLEERLSQFVADNAANPAPLRAVFRLDAGFGTAENIAWLIEMGYEVYSKPYSSWLSAWFRQQAAGQATWHRVGKNAEMIAWKGVQLDDFPYPLDLAWERFQTGPELRFSGQIHFGDDDVTADLPQWFRYYNSRQTIEAGHREGKQVFEVHHLKVRSQPALRLQEQFALFAATFVRLASVWLTEQDAQIPDDWREAQHPRVKEQVKIGAQTSAWVIWIGQDCLLRFTHHSVFAGRSLDVKRQWAFQPALPFRESCYFVPT